MTAQIGEELGIIGTIDPQSVAATSKQSAWIDVAKYPRLAAIVMVGARDGNITAKIEEATDSSGTGAQDLKTLTVIAAASKQAIVSAHHEELTLSTGYSHIRMDITTTGTANLISGLVLGGNARFKPVENHDATTVAQVLN